MRLLPGNLVRTTFMNGYTGSSLLSMVRLTPFPGLKNGPWLLGDLFMLSMRLTITIKQANDSTVIISQAADGLFAKSSTVSIVLDRER
jgi:hypothetical protein